MKIELGGAWKAYQDEKELLQKENVKLRGSLFSSRDALAKLHHRHIFYKASLQASLNIQNNQQDLIKKLEKEIQNRDEIIKEKNNQNFITHTSFVACKAAHFALTGHYNSLMKCENEIITINDILRERLQEAEDEVCTLNEIYENNCIEFEERRKQAVLLADKLKKMTHAKEAQDKHVCLLVKEKDRLYTEVKRMNTLRGSCLKCTYKEKGDSNSSPSLAAHTTTPPSKMLQTPNKNLFSSCLNESFIDQEESHVSDSNRNSTPQSKIESMASSYKIIYRALEKKKEEIFQKDKEIEELKKNNLNLKARIRNSSGVKKENKIKHDEIDDALSSISRNLRQI